MLETIKAAFAVIRGDKPATVENSGNSAISRLAGPRSETISIPVGEGINREPIEPEAARELGLKMPERKPKPTTDEAELQRRREAFAVRQKELSELAAAEIESVRLRKVDQLNGITRWPHVVKPFERSGCAPVGKAFFEFVREEVDAQPVGLDELRKHIAEHRRRCKLVEQFGNENVGASRKAEKADMRKALLAGKTVPDELPHSREERLASLKARRRILKEAAGETAKLVLPILQENAAQLAAACGMLADRLEASERQDFEKTAAKFGWQYEPSRLVITLRQCEHWRVAESLPLVATWAANYADSAAQIGIDL